ncbi:hypothetical protein LCGC14_0147300 [marine sediment metagenome]|uniref:Uncharacterized protein n=1 Tax=marine sediment metagenome TaxID=412755 RepID=A0A0F9Y1S7_9ZZZZ
MEKLGVDQGQDDLTKQGTSDVLCPECGVKMEQHGQVMKCPVHGTEPLEKGSKNVAKDKK